ncbi:small ribosomal subunit protein mS39-like [Glandiceps talaboti]
MQETVPQNAKGSSSPVLSEEETIIIPRRKKRDSLAVLRALASTVGKDHTAMPYEFHDDPFLLPTNAIQRKIYFLSAESGRKTAQYVLSSYPHLFTAMHNEPKSECLYPKLDGYIIEDACEEGLLERVNNRDVKAAMQMHDKIVEEGKEVSLDANNALLDLLCFYGGQEAPKEFKDTSNVSSETKEDVDENEDGEVEEKAPPEPRHGRQARMAARFSKRLVWNNGNYAEKVFHAMEERNSHSYCSMIRGMIKYHASAKAFEMYNEMQDKHIRVSVEAYNDLIYGVFDIRESHIEKWKLIELLLKQMKVEGVKPNLNTFNVILNAQKRMGGIGRKMSLQTISEMVALGIEPCLASYAHLIAIFYKPNLPPNDMLYDIMDEIDGKHFTIQDPIDQRFCLDAMSVCERLRDLGLAHRVNNLLNTGENHKLLGSQVMRAAFYSKLFSLICQLDTPENIMKFYKEYIPSNLVPSAYCMLDLLHAVEMYSMFDKLPDLWRDTQEFGHRYRQQLIDQYLYLMAKDTHSVEIQEKFAEIALDIAGAVRESARRRDKLLWSTPSLGHVVMLCLRGKKLDKAWEAMQMYRVNHKVPSSEVIDMFLNACIKVQDSQKALGLVKVIVGSGLSTFPAYVDKIKSNFPLSSEDLEKLEETIRNEEVLFA